MKIEDFIEKCEKSENLEVRIKNKDEYHISVKYCSNDVKEYIIGKLMSIAEEDFIEDFVMIRKDGYYGEILLYKMDDIIKAILTSDNYDKMYEKLKKIENESEGKRLMVSYKSKYGIKTDVGIRFFAKTYSDEKTNKLLKDKFVEILLDLGVGYEIDDENKVYISDRKCNKYAESKMWCKDTHQKEEFDKLFGF